jgi:pyruvate formate lyase activating enzyme
MLSDHDKRIVARFSLIPGVNDGEGNIGDLGAFVASLKSVREVHILPYHRAGVEKVRRLRAGTKPFVTDSPSAEAVRSTEDQLRDFGLRIQIGG